MSKHYKLHHPVEKHFSHYTLYHYYFFFLLFLSTVPVFWHILSLIFLSPPMDFYCRTSNGTALESALMKNYCPCETPEWDRSTFTETVNTKFNLFCERSWVDSMLQTALYAGTLTGALIFGFLSDKFGRLAMYAMCCFLLSVSGCLATVMPTPLSYGSMRVIEGIASGGAIIICFVLAIEYCGVKHRETVTAIFHISINVGHMTLAGVSYILRHCDHYQVAISLPVLFFVSLNWLLLESPKWLMDREMTGKAISTMEKIAKFNKLEHAFIKQEIEEFLSKHSNETRKKIRFWQILRDKQLAINLGCMSIIYFVCGLGYYGVSQFIGKMGGDIHVNVATSGAMLLPGTVVSWFLLKCFGRRSILFSTSVLSGIFMIIVIFIPSDMQWVRVILACICNCFYFMSFIIVFLYGVELFPTSVRNSVLGILSLLSRVGQMCGPLVNSVSDKASGSIFGVLAIIAALLCLVLPETKNVELPSSLEETKSLPRHAMDLEIETEETGTPVNPK